MKRCIACGTEIPLGLFCLPCAPSPEELCADLAGRLEAAMVDLQGRDQSGIALRERQRARITELEILLEQERTQRRHLETLLNDTRAELDAAEAIASDLRSEAYVRDTIRDLPAD